MTPPGAALLLLSHFHFSYSFLLANISSHLEVLYTYAVGREYFKIIFFFKPKTNPTHMWTKSKSATSGRPRNRELWEDVTCCALTYWDSGSWQWSQAQGGACEPPECRPALSESAGRNYFTAVNYMQRWSLKFRQSKIDHRVASLAVKWRLSGLPHTECCRWWWRRCWCASSASPPAAWTDCVCAWSPPSSCRGAGDTYGMPIKTSFMTDLWHDLTLIVTSPATTTTMIWYWQTEPCGPVSYYGSREDDQQEKLRRGIIRAQESLGAAFIWLQMIKSGY